MSFKRLNREGAVQKSWIWLAWVALAVACMVLRGPCQKRAAQGWDVGKVGMFAAAVSFVVWVAVDALDKSPRRAMLSSSVLWWAAGAGVVSTVGAMAVMYALRRAPVASVNAAVASHAVLVLFAAWALVGERPTLEQAVGSALVTAGVIMVAR